MSKTGTGIFGDRKKKGVEQLRDEVIRGCCRLGMTQERICKELDFNQELQQKDPLLQRWRDEFSLDRTFGYLDAFNHPRLKDRIETMISRVPI